MLDSCLVNEISFVNLIFIVFLASVQIYIQIVPLCDYYNNIGKQVYMAFEHGQQVSKDKFLLQRDPFFNLTRILPKFTNVLCIQSLLRLFILVICFVRFSLTQ